MNANPDLVIGDDGRARPEWAVSSPLLRHYYDAEWGMPIRDERGLFERISLEAFQSGLRWAIILGKRDGFRRAFAHFEPDVIAGFDEADIARLMNDPEIVRNRRKIAATVGNARATVALRSEGGLVDLVWSFLPECTPAPRSAGEIRSTSPESVALSKTLKAKGFSFVGPTTVYAMMQAIGMVDDHLLGSWRRGSSGVFGPDGRPVQSLG